MVPSTGLLNYYGRLERILKDLSLRLKLIIALEFLLRLASVFLIILLGSLLAKEAKEVLPYLPFIYCILALISVVVIFMLGIWGIVSRHSMLRIARGLEDKFPQLRDDVTNSLLLFRQINKRRKSDQISTGLVSAHLRKTADEVSAIHPKQVISFKRALSHVRILLPLFLVFTVVLALEPQFLGRSLAFILHPLSSLPEREVFIKIEPAPALALRGSPLVIKATTSGYIPERLLLRLWPEKGDVVRIDMEPEGDGRFTHLIASAQTSFRYQAYSGTNNSPGYHVRVEDAPDIGMMKLSLTPPDYTGLAREDREGGHIEALKGTVVNLEARATKMVKEGKLILNQQTQLPLQIDGERLNGKILVYYPGSYVLSIRDEFGFENVNPVQYRIKLVPDKYPEGEIIVQAEELEISGSEVLPVIYNARDDFGLTAAKLIFNIGGAERSISLKRFKNIRAVGPENFKWDLRELALTPGERVAYRLEVWDNDSVSGPKVGYSKTFTLHVRDDKDQAFREAERAQEISNALLDLLADQLEDVKNRKEISGEIARIREKVEKQHESMGTDKTERFDLESLKRNLDTLDKRIDELPDETVTQEMERLALLAEDLVKKARMHEVEALSREMKNRQRRFIDSLRDLKGLLNPDSLQGLLKELDKLKDLAAQVMEALSQMATQLPDEFINSPELRDLNLQDLFKDFDEIQRKLMAGDLAGALEAAQRMLQALSEMMAAMARAGLQASMGASQRLQLEMARQANELEKIVKEQQEILTETEAIEEELKELIDTEIEDRLDRMMSGFQETVAQLQNLLPSEERDALFEMEKLLQAGQIERISEFAKGLQQAYADEPDANSLIEQLMRMTEKLTPDRREIMAEDDRREFPGLSSRQENLQERTSELGNKLKMLSQLFPGMDTEIINDIKDASGSMGSATLKLEMEDAQGAIPPEEEAIRSLSKSQQAMQQMAQQMAMRMQADRWGYSLFFSGWYDWFPRPSLPQPEVKRPRERGYTGIDKEEFDPPSRDTYKAPKILREKVMEALKEDIPSQYRREVERYFKGLTE